MACTPPCRGLETGVRVVASGEAAILLLESDVWVFVGERGATPSTCTLQTTGAHKPWKYAVSSGVCGLYCVSQSNFDMRRNVTRASTETSRPMTADQRYLSTMRIISMLASHT